MAIKQFKAESKRLLDLMINSIYTHKEIFLRELISNASDAIDKLYFKSLTDDSVKIKKSEYEIRLSLDKENRMIKLQDNGIGMSKDELEKNLGTIARSGSLDFKQENAENSKIDIIGQFGVGFYSAFMVASKVTVISRAFGSDEAWKWESNGADGYTIVPYDKENVGTDIVLIVKENSDGENYDEYLEDFRIVSIIKKYSDYIRYPIRMMREHSRLKEGSENEYEKYQEDETLNSMVPLWRKAKKDVSTEQYNEFYKEKFYDYEDPQRVIQSKTEGVATYNSLLFIPARAPYNYYTKEYEKGLQLYASGVLIMEKCADLLPDYFSFVHGLVDSQDLSLNISRETLQHDSQLKVIRTSLEKKIKSELSSMLSKEREEYDKFFKNFGLQLKVGCYSGYGSNKDILQDLILFTSAKQEKLVSLAEYVAAMSEDQKYIYYAAGDSVERLAKLPQAERVLSKGFDILYLTDDVDEFVLQVLHEYDKHEFRNISGEDLGIETEEEKEEIKAKNDESKELLAAMKAALGDKVSAVQISQRLISHPVCLTSSGALSIEMEKVLNSMPTDEKVKSEKVLEINAEHNVFKTLCELQTNGETDKINAYADILYSQALLIEGMSLPDPVAYANAVCELMTKQ